MISGSAFGAAGIKAKRVQQDDGAVVRLGEGGGGDGFGTGRLLAGGFAVPHHGDDVVAGEIPRQAEQFFLP
mgnify:CR=1 FL=1